MGAPATLFVVSRSTASRTRGPRRYASPMCETSNSPTASRTALCSLIVPGAYCTGMSQPPKSMSRAPSSLCTDQSGVFLRSDIRGGHYHAGSPVVVERLVLLLLDRLLDRLRLLGCCGFDLRLYLHLVRRL